MLSFRNMWIRKEEFDEVGPSIMLAMIYFNTPKKDIILFPVLKFPIV
jgi:hypothetical protein